MRPAPAGVTLRAARPEDADAGAALHAACWREAYGPLVDAGLLEAALADTARFEAGWRRRLVAGEPRVLAETADGGLVGFAQSGPARQDPAVARHELYAIYVREAWWGTGLGAALFDAVDPGGSCSLWVLAANARARRFYERRGFVPDGTEKVFGRLAADELRLVRNTEGRAAVPDP